MYWVLKIEYEQFDDEQRLNAFEMNFIDGYSE